MTSPEGTHAVLPLLRAAGLTKTFGATRALDDVSLDVHAGEVHAILGENGAGKTTLMNVLDGLVAPDAGTLSWRGSPVRLRSPGDAQRLGVAMVHQHFMLVPALTVAENLLLAHPDRDRFLLDRDRARAWVRDIAQRHGFLLDPDARVGELPVGARQRVEIAKALARDAALLILDEPTAVLTPREAEELFRLVRALREQGSAILFISHKLPEVLELSDRITVMRRGRVVGRFRRGEADAARLAAAVLGTEASPSRALAQPASERGRGASQGERIVLEARGLGARFPNGLAVRDVDFTVHAGEIFAVTGVDGNGQEELAALLAGIARADAGSLALNGEDVTRAGVRERWTRGLSVLPGDRTHEGVIGDFAVWENLSLRDFGAPFARRLGGLLIDPSAHQTRAAELVAAFDVRASGVRAKARTLSGGNQQKLLLAREMTHAPRAIVAVNPTRGLDVGASRDVLARFVAMRDNGGAVLLVSTELDEVLEVADRVAVMSMGRLREISAPDRERVGAAMLAAASA